MAAHTAGCGLGAHLMASGGGALFFSQTFFHFKPPQGPIQTSWGPLWCQGWLLLDPQAGILTLAVEGCSGVSEME